MAKLTVILMLLLIAPGQLMAQCNTIPDLDLPFSGNANDNSANNNNGIVIGASLVQDRFGNPNSAYYFDGGDLIDVPEDVSVQPNFPLSLSMWIWVDSTAGAQLPFFSNEDNPNRFCGIWMDVVNDKITFSYGNGQAGFSTSNIKTYTGNTTVTREEWHHVCVVAHSPTDVDMYLDMVLQNTTIYGNASTLAYVSAVWDVSVGSERGQYFKGAIDDVKLYADSLCASERSALYTPGTDNNPFCDPTTATDVQTACYSFQWIDGNTYTSNNNTATFMLTTAQGGCDSLVTLNLTINTVDVSTTQAGATITAVAAGATYRWLDCDNGYSVISGEVSQNFIAQSNGNYAVEVTQNGCVDTSSCVSVTGVGIDAYGNGRQVSIYPNPVKDQLTIDWADFNISGQASWYDLTGGLVKSSQIRQAHTIISTSDLANGVYFIEIKDVNNAIITKQKVVVGH
ncbi:MAG: T9SS type A sorting domain-containing protein [Flavobacteriales bacterium]|nr:T9SS type A sorting domain-containing protein [Flavobacteriales bacterium]